MDAVEKYASKIAPTAMNSASVTIVGQPDASMNDLFRLALGIITGTLGSTNPLGLNPSHTISSEFDYTAKVVSVTLVLEASGMMQILAAGNGPSMFRRNVPDTISVGKYPSSIGSIVPPDSNTIDSTGKPPDMGSVALSSAPAENPFLPFGNGTSGQQNTTAKAAPIKGTFDKVGERVNDTLRNGLTEAQMIKLKKAFGI